MSATEHPTPTCPDCGGEKTRPLDEEVGVCFGCDAQWHYEEDYSEYWETTVSQNDGDGE